MTPDASAPASPSHAADAERIAALEAENAALRQRVALLERLVPAELDAATARAVEAARQEGEHRYRVVSELMSDFVFEGLLHADGTRETIWAAGSYGQIVEQSGAAALVRQSFSGFVHPDDLTAYEAYTAALHAGKPQSLEYRIVRRSGEVRWMRVSIRPEPVEGRPGVIRCIGAGRDITALKQAEAALRAGEERYRTISELVLDYFFELQFFPDGERRVIWTGGAFGRIFGYSVEEAHQMTFREIVYPADQPLYDEYNRALFAGRSATTEVRVYHRDGRLLWAQITAHATPPARPGEPIVVIGAGRDITALKQAEAALRASEARYRAAVDQQAEQVCRFSVPDYRITFANEAYARFYRRAQAELIGLGIADLVPPDVHAVAVAQLRAITPANPAQVVEMYSAGPDGELRWRQWSDTAVFDAEGRIVEIQSVGRDITELKLVEAELRQLNAELEARVAERTAELRRANEELRRGGVLLRTVVDTLSDGIALIRPDGVILVANAGLGALLGVAPEGLVGTAWAGPALPAAELVLAAAAEGRPRSGRELFVGADGRRRVLDVQVGLPETREAGAERLVIRLSDVTERLQLERMVIENERLAASGRLAAIAAHEINTPLQSVQNLLYLAVQGSAAGDGVDDLIALSLDEIGRVSGILRRLLSLSQIAAGDEAPADCNTVIERVMLLTGSTLARKRIALDRGLATGLPPVRLGGDLITQVLLNLVVNAIDAMPRGGRLRVGTAVVAGPAVELIIHDTGDGISPEDQVRIFEPFFTRKEGGTGLGLAVSRHIVEQAGGELLVESALGAGTTFTVRLPVAGEGA